MWKSSIVKVFDRNFPDSVYKDQKSQFYDIENQTKSDLPLQVFLYLNVWLYPLWLLVLIVNLDAKYYSLTDVYKLLTVAVFLVLSILEGLRLYLGYLGNLAGKIPELASFWLISTLIQLPLEAFLIFDNGTLPRISETLVNCLMTFLLATEIITGTIALKSLADRRAKRFYLAQLYGMDDTLNRG